MIYQTKTSKMANSKRRFWNILLVALGIFSIAGYYIYQILIPSGPILDPIPNLVSDKATTSKNIDDNSIDQNPLREVYFGDLHVHTSFSFDAYIGGTTSTPSSAYAFAKGEEANVLGTKFKIKRPLDFAAVTDHAEFIGELYSVKTKGAPSHRSLMAYYFRSIGTDTIKQRDLFNRIAGRIDATDRTHLDLFKGFETTKSAWKVNLEAAEAHYEPGKFTTFAAYEWTKSGLRPNGRLGAHYHRNLFFKDMIVPDYPVSAFEANTTEALWKWMDEITKAGATVMAIPHNSNLAGGGMFLGTNMNGEPIDSEYAKLSNKYEPLVEIHQAKGNSEVNQSIWTTDEFSDFENYSGDAPVENDYARYALKKGLKDEANLGTNPHKYGFIGSTDTHNGIPGNTEEDNAFVGNHARLDLNARNRRIADWILDPKFKTYQVVNPGGLIAVWAEANTRTHVFEAMQRKETYATSGGRIQVRFFAGYDFKQNTTDYEAMVADAYQKGVPMGGDIQFQEGQAPQFLIWAAKDPEGANLDRIQVIKGWYKEGALEEKIFNVALSDDRQVDDQGKVPDLEAPIDWETGSWDKSKGATVLQTIWVDPEFDPEARAFYYLRVLELPTPTYRGWDKIRYEINFPEGTKLSTRERAWSSPIWYSPN